MKRIDIKRIFVALAALVGLLGLGSAQAAVYTAVWDPAYGPAFPNLGWKGQSSFFVPTSCLPAGSGQANVSNEGSGGCDGNGHFATMQSASVDLYNLTTGCLIACVASGDSTTLGFTASTLTILNLRFLDGVLIGLETSRSNGVETDFVGSENDDVTFFLQFLLGPPLDNNPLRGSNGVASANAFGAYTGPVLSFVCCQLDVSGSNSYAPDSFVITRIDEVPEPASLSLAALGLAVALGWGRSRRRRQG